MLTDLFRGFEPATEAMVVGTCVHVILQTCLRKNIIHIEDISNILDKELATPNNVSTLISWFNLVTVYFPKNR